MEEKNDDFLDRKVNGFERVFEKFFDAVVKDAKSFFIVILVITNIVIFYKYTNSLEVRLDDNKVYSERMIETVKEQLRPEINENIEKRTSQIETKVDSASISLEQLKQTIKTAIK